MSLHGLPKPHGFSFYDVGFGGQGGFQVAEWPTQNLCEDGGKRRQASSGFLSSMWITNLCSRRNRPTDIQPPSRNDSSATGIAAENPILVPLCAGLGYGFGLGAPERAGQTQVTATDRRRSHSQPNRGKRTRMAKYAAQFVFWATSLKME
jgi:hypothetical protein